MDLGGAYRVLELDPGASEETVRDARKTLVKVWHPDRHANDPALEKRAQIKLAEVNDAFETIRAAGFPPASAAAPKPAPAASPPRAAPPPPAAPPPEPEKSTIEIVPRRRVRWSVLLLLLAALGAGAYLAVLKLGGGNAAPVAARDAGAVAVVPPVVADAAPLDAAAVAVAVADDAAMADDAAEVAVAPQDAPSTYRPPATDKTFGLGATHEQVRAAQGAPTSQQTVVDEQWMYGYSIVTFNRRGKVVGWWDRDDVLNVKLVPGDPDVAARAKAAGGYEMGASKDEVIGAQGTPNRIETVVDETWYFGTTGSSLTFNGTGRVTAYHNVDNELNLH